MCSLNLDWSFLENFDRTVAVRGSAVAIQTAEGKAWTYAELSHEAHALAAQLEATGVSEGSIVAMKLPRSPEYVASLLAIWRRRAVALLVDVNQPESRIQAIFHEAQPFCVLELHGGEVQVCLYAEQPTLFSAAEGRLPAYVIYTSGSSGKPKGVLVSHAGLVPILAAQIDLFRITSQSRCWWVHGTGFDASLSDIGTALLAGATLCFAKGQVEWQHALQKHAITHVDLPPALLTHLEARPASLECIIIGGEVCPAAVVRKWAAQVRLINVYGPTEATICTSMVVCDAAWDKACISKPVAGMVYQEKDGELVISGPGVALGYPWLPEEWSKRCPDGCYHTGDLVRPCDDGSWEFLGRKDRQFKLQGRLICPEEVERALVSLPGVLRAHVMPWALGKRHVLAACIECSSKEMLVSEVKAALQAALPTWMVPTAWCQGFPLPTLSNGKPDERAITSLLAAEVAKRAHSKEFNATGLEWEIAEIFAEVLELPKVLPDEDFFDDLGGDSLSVVSFMALAVQRGWRLPPDAVARGRSAMGVAALREAVEWLHTSDILADVQLPLPSFTMCHLRPQTVLVTGASGFLGRALVAELKAAGLVVLEMSRNSGLKGNVALPRFGWDEETWQERAQSVDTVFHLAAEVRLFEPYAALRASQVVGTDTVLAFCAAGQPKALHFASSLSVFVDADPRETWCRECDLRRGVSRLHGGYAQAKWVAEQRVLAAMEHGLSAAVHRLGLLGPHGVTGDKPTQDWLQLALRGFSTADDSLEMDLTPVDYAAALMARIAMTNGTGIYHIANPQPVTLGQLAAVNPNPQANAPACLATLRRTYTEFPRSLDLFKSTGIRFEMERSQALLGSAMPLFPRITNDYLQTCFPAL